MLTILGETLDLYHTNKIMVWSFSHVALADASPLPIPVRILIGWLSKKLQISLLTSDLFEMRGILRRAKRCDSETRSNTCMNEGFYSRCYTLSVIYQFKFSPWTHFCFLPHAHFVIISKLLTFRLLLIPLSVHPTNRSLASVSSIYIK